jgi:3,2-trans-enoyl-CoA isomerase
MLDVIEHSERIREIRLARPPVNALNGGLLAALTTAVSEAAGPADALLISGAPGVFSAGLDVPGLLALDRDAAVAVFAELWQVQRAIATSPIPVIFAITGHCPAGGTVLAMHGDYRVLAQGDFLIGLNEVQVGLFPGGVIHDAFRRLVGGHTAQLLTRGALLDPATALRVGLVDELCAADRCVARALEVAHEYCALPREPMRRTRELVRRDLTQLFGTPAAAHDLAREFGAMGADWFFVPETQERLRTMFARKKAAR